MEKKELMEKCRIAIQQQKELTEHGVIGVWPDLGKPQIQMTIPAFLKTFEEYKIELYSKKERNNPVKLYNTDETGLIYMTVLTLEEAEELKVDLSQAEEV